MATIEQLIELSEEIRTNSTAASNTNELVGSTMKGIAEKLQEESEGLEEDLSSIGSRVTEVEATLDATDSTPTASSDHLVKSGGVYAALQALENALRSSGYRIAGFIGPDNSYLAKAVEGTCYFITNPASASWYGSVVGRVYLQAGTTTYTEAPSSVSGWTRFDITGACIVGYKGGAWSLHNLPFALLTQTDELQTAINRLALNVFNEITGYDEYTYGISVSGDTVSLGSTNTYKHGALEVTAGQMFAIENTSPSSDNIRFVFTTSNFTSSGTVITPVIGSVGVVAHGTRQVITIPEGCTYLLWNSGGLYSSKLYGVSDNAHFATGESVRTTGIDAAPTADSTNLVKSGGVKAAMEKTSEAIVLVGAGNTIANSSQIHWLKPGNKYRLWVKNPNISKDEVTYTSSSYNWLYVAAYANGEQTSYLVQIPITAPALSDHYDFIVPDGTDYIRVGTRANTGLEQVLIIEDMSSFYDDIHGEDEPVAITSWSDGVFNGSVGNVPSWGSASSWKHSNYIPIPESVDSVYFSLFYRNHQTYKQYVIFIGEDGTVTRTYIPKGSSTYYRFSDRIEVIRDGVNDEVGMHVVTGNDSGGSSTTSSAVVAFMKTVKGIVSELRDKVASMEDEISTAAYVEFDKDNYDGEKGEFVGIIDQTTGVVSFDSGQILHFFALKKGETFTAVTTRTGTATQVRMMTAAFTDSIPSIGDTLQNPFRSVDMGDNYHCKISLTVESDSVLAISHYENHCDFSVVIKRPTDISLKAQADRISMNTIRAQTAADGFASLQPYKEVAGAAIRYEDGDGISKGDFYTEGVSANYRIRLYRMPDKYVYDEFRMLAQVARFVSATAPSGLVAHYKLGSEGQLVCLDVEHKNADNLFAGTAFCDIHPPQGTEVIAVASNGTKITDKGLRFASKKRGMKILCIGDSWGRDTMRELWGLANDAGYDDIVVGQAYQGGCGLNMQYAALSNHDYFYYHTSFYQYVYGNYQYWFYGSQATPTQYPSNSNYANGKSGTPVQVTVDDQTINVYGKSNGEWAGYTLEQILGSDDWDIILIRLNYQDLLLPTTLTSDDDGTGFSIDILDFIEQMEAMLTPVSQAKVKWGLTNCWTYPEGCSRALTNREKTAILSIYGITEEEWNGLTTVMQTYYRDALRSDHEKLRRNFLGVARHMDDKCSYMVDTSTAIEIARKSGNFEDVGYKLIRSTSDTHLADGLPKYICAASLCYELFGFTPIDFKDEYQPNTASSGGDGDDSGSYPITTSRCIEARKAAWEAYCGYAHVEPLVLHLSSAGGTLPDWQLTAVKEETKLRGAWMVIDKDIRVRVESYVLRETTHLRGLNYDTTLQGSTPVYTLTVYNVVINRTTGAYTIESRIIAEES